MKLRPPPEPPLDLDVLLRNDLATFTEAMFPQVVAGGQLIWAPYLSLVCAKLMAVAEGQIRHLIITMPPRHLKSFCVSVALPAFILGRDPTKEVLCISYGHDLAKKFAEDFYKVMQSAAYRRAFGEVLPARRQTLSYIRTSAGGGRRATSLDGVATGIGGDFLIFDDPQKPGETLSDAVRRSTNSAYENTFLSRRNNPKEACIIIVMQRLHEDDFVHHVQELGGDWQVINLPAIAEADEAITYETPLAGRKVFRRREGDALHPARLPLEELQLMRTAFGEAVWQTQFQQRPAPAGGGMVKTAWLRPYREDQLPSFNRVVQSWDTANKLQEWHDFSVCTTWGVKDKHAYLLGVYRERLDYPALRAAVIRLAAMHDANEVFIEDASSGAALIQDLRGHGFGRVRGVKHSVDKATRMINQTAWMENGFVHLPEAAPWLDDYLHELAMFPNGKFDDQIDSTSQALEAIHTSSGGMGVFEFMRQEAEKLKAELEQIVVLRPPPGMGMVSAIDGTEYRPGPDGLFRIPGRHVGPLRGTAGWSVVTQP